MVEMNFKGDIDLKVGEGQADGPACAAGKPSRAAGNPGILTYRYPDGFKTGIYKYRLVSIGINWYRFTRFVEGDANCGKTPVGHKG